MTIAGRCDAIVTSNLRHFPDAAVEPFGIEVRHPDEFLCDCLDLAPGAFCEAVRKVRGRLKKPPFTLKEYLAKLHGNGAGALTAPLPPHTRRCTPIPLSKPTVTGLSQAANITLQQRNYF